MEHPRFEWIELRGLAGKENFNRTVHAEQYHLKSAAFALS